MTHIARSTLIIALFFTLEKVLGFLRQILIARQFGLSAELDVFNAANNIPDLLFVLISGGAMAMAFIPVLSEVLEKEGRPAAWSLFSRIANLVFVVTAGLSVLVALFAERLVASQMGVVPGFSAQQQALVVELMRLNLVATLLFSISGLVMAGLQANQHFFLPALAPSMYDVGMLFGVLVLAPEKSYSFGPLQLPALGLGVHGLVYGTILGALLFLGIQAPGLIRYGFRWTATLGLKTARVRQVLALLGPRVLTVATINFIFLAQDNIASRMAPGAISALVYGWLFMQMPETLIGTALGTALLPTLAEQAARGDDDSFYRTLHNAFRAILALALPAAALLMAGIRPVVSILGFDEASIELVTWTTRGYLVGLVGHSLIDVAARAFYARQDARTPLLASVVAALGFIVMALPLASALGAPGIGLANALAYSGQALALWLLLWRKAPKQASMTNTLARAAVGAALGAALVLGLNAWLPLPNLLRGALALGVGGLAALPWMWRELQMLRKI